MMKYISLKILLTSPPVIKDRQVSPYHSPGPCRKWLSRHLLGPVGYSVLFIRPCSIAQVPPPIGLPTKPVERVADEQLCFPFN